MPMFSKMMSSYPFKLIRGLGPGIAAGALVGSVSADRGERMRGAVRGAASGAIAYGGVKAYHAMGGMEGLSTLARNLKRPGVAGMFRNQVHNATWGAMGAFMRNAKQTGAARTSFHAWSDIVGKAGKMF